MGAGYVHLWHVAGSAVNPRHRASFGPGLSAAMTSLAFRIVIRRYSINFLVRIVAADAADALIFHIVTTAVGEPVRLEADV